MKVLFLIPVLVILNGCSSSKGSHNKKKMKKDSLDYSGFKSLVEEYYTTMDWGKVPKESWDEFDKVINPDFEDKKIQGIVLDGLGRCQAETEKILKLKKSNPQTSSQRLFAKSLIEFFAGLHAISLAIDPSQSEEDRQRYQGDGNAIFRSIKADIGETERMFSKRNELQAICNFYNRETNSENDCKSEPTEIMKGQLIAEAGKNTGMSNLEKLRIGDSKRALNEIKKSLERLDALTQEEKNNIASAYLKIRDGFFIFLSRKIPSIQQRNYDAAVVMSELATLLPNIAKRRNERENQDFSAKKIRRRKASVGSVSTTRF